MGTKVSGGLGRCDLSYWKHDHIERFILRQIPVLAKRGRGLILDMNAGDGYETPHPQGNLFSNGSLKTSPTIAISAARKYHADVILCENNRERRESLVCRFGSDASVIGNHEQILEMSSSISNYPWIITISDPNGYANQGVDVMKWISSCVPISDFIIVVNCQSITRCLGLKDQGHFNVRMAYQSGVENKWMLDHEQWKAQLKKAQCLFCGPKRLSKAMEAMVLLVSNFIPGYTK